MDGGRKFEIPILLIGIGYMELWRRTLVRNSCYIICYINCNVKLKVICINGRCIFQLKGNVFNWRYSIPRNVLDHKFRGQSFRRVENDTTKLLPKFHVSKPRNYRNVLV